MQVIIIGAGPVGSVAALLLARAGYEVTVVDREPGPTGGVWERRGIFQFHLPHGFRTPTARHLSQRLPDIWDALVAAGGLPVAAPGNPAVAVGLHLRREVLDEVLWHALRQEPGVDLRCGHVDRPMIDGQQVTGVIVDGVALTAGLVVDASGRGRVSAPLRGRAEGGPCGFAYVARRYRLRDGAEPGPFNMPAGYAVGRPGYLSMVFQHDGGYFDVLLVRAGADTALAELRHEKSWDEAVRLLPGARVWADPERARPAGPVRAGGGLTNSYLGQAVGLSGLLAIGDAVAITNPSGGRGVSLGIASAVAMADIVAAHPSGRWAGELEAWCETELHQWVTDQIATDASTLRHWAGEPFDPSEPLPVDLVRAALGTDPALAPVLLPYDMLAATSKSFGPLLDRAREILDGGWRPSEDDAAPTRAELVAAGTAGGISRSAARRYVPA